MGGLQVQPSLIEYTTAQKQKVSLMAIDKRTVHEQ